MQVLILLQQGVPARLPIRGHQPGHKRRCVPSLHTACSSISHAAWMMLSFDADSTCFTIATTSMAPKEVFEVQFLFPFLLLLLLLTVIAHVATEYHVLKQVGTSWHQEWVLHAACFHTDTHGRAYCARRTCQHNTQSIGQLACSGMPGTNHGWDAYLCCDICFRMWSTCSPHDLSPSYYDSWFLKDTGVLFIIKGAIYLGNSNNISCPTGNDTPLHSPISHIVMY